MSVGELLSTTAIFAGLLVTAFGTGALVLTVLARITRMASAHDVPSAEYVGLALMLGLGTIGWLATWIGFAGTFSRSALIGACVLLLAASARELRSITRRGTALVREWPGPKQLDPVVAVLVIGIIALLGTLYLSALQPPYASDELHYHFPQAEALADSGRLTMPLGGHGYYGNIPKLMEIIFAFGIVMGGYSIAHALHFAFVLGFVVFVGGFLTRHHGARTGWTAALLILFYRQYTWNATVGFVDAATASLEVGALLLAVDWFVTARPVSLSVSAGLLGLAVGMKYSPLPTVLLIVVAATVVAMRTRRPTLRQAVVYVAVAAFFGGFWYVRNLVELGNPVYPFYFGHEGLSDEAYRALLADLRQFGPRTLSAFVSTPKRLFAENDFVALATVLAPFGLLARRSRPLLVALLAYGAAYATYWFFFATHQTRFLMPAMLVAIVLAAVVLASFPRATMLLVLPLVGREVWRLRGDLAYARGAVDRATFLGRHFGCQYQVIAFLEREQLRGSVIDNWSVWHAPSVKFHARQNSFVRFSFPLRDRGSDALAQALAGEDLRYVFIDTTVKGRHLANPDPDVAKGRAERAKTEAIIVQNADLSFTAGACRLYRIDSARLASASRSPSVIVR